jgi:eukaryotic-like serine/threonine-protein kinase
VADSPSPVPAEETAESVVVPSDGPPADWATPPELGEVITSEATGNTYTMGGKIGEGHFGTVYSCVDVWKNDLAAKVMKPLAPYEKVRELTVAEFQKLLHLRHPHITYVYDAFEFRDTFYIITERCYCPVKDLFNLDPFYGSRWIKPIARCLLQALHFLHTNGIAHQDIHSGNVFASFAKNEMNSDDIGAIQFKLGDFGVAKLFSEIDESNTRAQWMLPPEVLERTEFGPIDHRIDIYHCGLLFLCLAHGSEISFTPEEIKAGLPRDLALQLQPPYNFALEKALRRHVQSRTESAMELWRDLNSPEPEKPKASEPMELDFGGEST